MKKSQLKGFILALLFGPLGLFYSSIPAALVLLVVAVIAGAISSGIPLVLDLQDFLSAWQVGAFGLEILLALWPIAVIVSIFSVSKYNSKLGTGTERVELKAAQEELEVWKANLGAWRAELEARHAELELEQAEQEVWKARLGVLRADLRAEQEGLEAWKDDLVPERIWQEKENNEVTTLERFERPTKSSSESLGKFAGGNTEARASALKEEQQSERKVLNAWKSDLDTKRVRLEKRGANLEAKKAELKAREAELEPHKEELTAKQAGLNSRNVDIKSGRADTGIVPDSCQERPGNVEGVYFTAHVGRVEQLKREGRSEEAIALLLKLVAATEAESEESGGRIGVARWYYEQLATVYSKEERFADEVAILERYESQAKAPGVVPGKSSHRLATAREKLSRPGEMSDGSHEGPFESFDKDETAVSDEHESDLASFRISVTTEDSEKQNTKNKQPGRWIQPGEAVKVGKFEIHRGFLYVGGQLKASTDYYSDNDPSLIDPTLRIDVRSPDYAGDQMSYWPSYSRISPQSRAAYIEWLSSDRNDPETYIGYVFLYFYGIERRLLVDDKNGGVSDEERKALIQELKRLKNVYGDHRSFGSYVTALLSHAWVVNHKSLEEQPDYDLLVAKRDFTSFFKFLLAKAIQNGDPVNAELALAWVKSHPEFTLRTPARRCPLEFDALFRMRYRSKFGDGLKITPTTTRLQLTYHPANQALIGYQHIRLDLPDVSRLSAPVKKLMTLAESCTSELDRFSRYVGRPGNSHDSLGALSLLPTDLISSVSSPQFETFKAWMKTQLSESNGVISVDSILQHFGEDAPLKINKKEAEMLSSIVEKAGFGIAPDVRFHHAKPDIDGKVVLFVGGHGANFTPSSEFRKVGTILRLGTLVAAIDDHVSDSEVSALHDLIDQNNRLTETEKRSLDAYMLWRLHTPPNMSGLKKRLDALCASEKIAISHILIGIALADGKIEPAEIRQLEKLYTQLGLDRGMVASDIHKLSSSRLPRPDRASKSSSAAPTRGETHPATSFSLDRDFLRLLEEETKEAQSVLESIFADESVTEESEVAPHTGAPPTNGSMSGLDTQHQQLYDKLISKAEWACEEMEELCNGLQLMPDGAVETINEWAFENVDAPLIEDGSTVYIDIGLAEEIAELQTQGQLP